MSLVLIDKEHGMYLAWERTWLRKSFDDDSKILYDMAPVGKHDQRS